MNSQKMLLQNPQSELSKVCMLFRCVVRDLWALKLYHKYNTKKRFLSLMNSQKMFFQNPQSEFSKVWILFSYDKK